MDNRKKAILVVSFGTSYEETRKKTIDRIEQDIREAYPEYAVYRAWTSHVIRRKLLQRDGIEIPDVKGAMEQMARDGITDVIVQPTHMLCGIEHERMKAEVQQQRKLFSHVVTGAQLLALQTDQDRVVQTVTQELQTEANEALVLMGHGTEHDCNVVYAGLDVQFKNAGYENIFMGTVEACPSLEDVLEQIREKRPESVVLAPFMIVAGDHASNDLAGDGADSWKSRLEAEGFAVRCVMKGLGEYPGIRNIFLDHVADAIRKLEESGAEESWQYK
jgi:sirohydrochlorin cobaltochelatase